MSATETQNAVRQATQMRERKLIALLEMASEAEKLNRYRQAKLLYERALGLMTMHFGACSVERAAVLFDLARISESQGENREAAGYYSQVYAIGCLGSLRKELELEAA
ncbi:MAG TPA: hypothetical protein V6D22_25055 [Candidatus Obscuribacterales bacterium]